MSSEASLASDAEAVRSETRLALSKAAHLSADLGRGEEAWDLGGRLLASPSAATVEAGTLVRMRLLGLQGRNIDALNLFADFIRRFPQAVPGPSLVSETLKLRQAVGKSTGELTPLLLKRAGPGAWVLQGDWQRLPGPAEAWGLSFQEVVRLQVGAFQDWGHALTLIDMLREKGWVPFVDLKATVTGDRLHLVYIVSRQPESDRERLAAQGLLTLP